jgi:glycosyltransferase involved in cell wall biosynthesis
VVASTDPLALENVDARSRRVLVLLGNIPLLGQERGNIQVFYALKRHNVDALFVTNRAWGHQCIQPMLDSLGLKWTAASYLGRFRKGMGIREWWRNIACIARGSLTLWKLLQKYKPTHIHLCNVDHFINFLPVLLMTRVPLIYRLGDVPARHRKEYRLLWQRIIIPKISKFVCISEFAKSSLVSLGAPEEKCRVIYNQAPARKRPAVSSSKAKLRKGRAYTVLYVGQLAPHKGVDVLVDAAMQMCKSRNDLEFLIAGDYEWQNEFARALMGAVESAGMAEQVRFLGYVDEVQDLFRLSDLHVLPSVWEEPLSNVVMEAKQAAIPSVVFSSGGIPEVIEHGTDGFICHDKTTEGLTTGLRYYIDRPVRTSTHGQNAKASLESLSVNHFGRLWDAVFDGA